MKELKLLSTDFDGTLVNFDTCEPCVDSLSEELEQACQQGVIWGINTGRPLSLLLEGLSWFAPPVRPHYLMTDERYIYYCDDSGEWKSLGDWNQQCDILHNELFKTCGLFFEQIEKITLEYHGAVIIHRDAQGTPEGLLATNGEALDEIGVQLLEHNYRPAGFLFQRSDTHLRFCHQFYNKGSTLTELSRFLSIEADHILAIGDHHNDLTMLNGEAASMVACPSNAHHEVKKTVSRVGGYISQYETGKGTADAIRRYSKSNNNGAF